MIEQINTKWFEKKIQTAIRMILFVVVLMTATIPVQPAQASMHKWLAQWFMDEGTGTVMNDSSSHGFHGTLYNVDWGAGKFDRAIRFNGATSYVDIPHTFDASFGSLSAWVKIPESAMDSMVIFSESNLANQEYPYFMVSTWNGRVGVYHKTGLYEVTRGFGDTAINDNHWHYLVWTQTGEAGGLKIYVDGILQTITWLSGSDNGTWLDDIDGDAYTLGVMRRNTYNWHGPFLGMMDEVTVFSRVLSAEDVQAYYQAGSGLLARWDMNNVAGQLVPDESGSLLDGTQNNCETGTGHTGNSLVFNGSTSYMDIPHEFDGDRGAVTAWVKTTNTGEYDVIFSEGLSTAYDGPYFMLGIDNGFASIYAKNGAEIRAIGETSVNDGEWHFIVWTYDGGTNGIDVYVDGKHQNMLYQVGNPTQARWWSDYAGDNYSLGMLHRRPGDHFGYFDGELDDVTIYHRPLTLLEIRAYSWNPENTIFIPLVAH